MHAFIWDFDGVIVDSEKYFSEWERTFYPRIVQGFNKTHAEAMMGLSLKAEHEYLVEKFHLSLTLDEYAAAMDADLRTVYDKKVNLLPGVTDVIRFLTERTIPMGIATSSNREWVEAALSRLGILMYFPVIATAENSKAKPQPDVYLLACKELGVQPVDCVSIEDSRNGVAAAKAAGVFCIALYTDINVHQDLSAADAHINGLAEAIPLLQQRFF